MEDLIDLGGFDKKIEVNIPIFLSNPLHFVNTKYFSEAGEFFKKNGFYCQYPKGTEGYYTYWRQQRDRCIQGFTVAGVRITGRHYFYLNFYMIKAQVEKNGRKKKEMTFPRFLDMDYYYFHEIDICLKTGEGLCIAKSRRKGFSFKNACLGLYEYTFEKDSTTIVGAYLAEYAQATMDMIVDGMNHLNAHSAFSKLQIIKQSDYKKSGYEETIGGQKVIKGFNSEVYILSFRDNHSAAIGKSASLFMWEEAGKFPNLLPSYEFTYDTLKDGDTTIGLTLIFGTGGDMQRGGSAGFEELFHNPQKYGLRCFDSKLYDDEDPEKYAGYFVDDLWYMDPFVDANGNSDRRSALKKNLSDRKVKMKDAKSGTGIENYVTQHPLTPRESFMITEGSHFPVQILQKRLNELLSSPLESNLGERGRLKLGEGSRVMWTPDPTLQEAPFPFDQKSIEGCVTIYEHPMLIDGSVADGLYIASTDPYMQDEAKTSDSLGSTLIYKKFWDGTKTHNFICAEYTGRPETADEYYENVRLLLMYYNATCLYENQFKDMKVYFEKVGSLGHLARQPQIIKDVIPKSVVNRGFGVHMPIELKMFGIHKARDWFKADRGDGKTNTDYIYSIYFLKEAIRFSLKGNFDRISSFLILMIYLEETHRILAKESMVSSQENFFNKYLHSTRFQKTVR